MFGELLGTLFYYFLLSTFFMAGNVLSAYGGVNIYEEFDKHVLPKLQSIADQCKRKVSPKVVVRSQQDPPTATATTTSTTTSTSTTNHKPE